MQSAHPVRGALLCVVAVALFACMDATTKYLSETHPVPLIVAARYLGNLLLMAGIMVSTHHARDMVRTQRTGLVWVRALCLAIASLLIGFALQRMPVAETTAILFLSPVLLVIVNALRLLRQPKESSTPHTPAAPVRTIQRTTGAA